MRVKTRNTFPEAFDLIKWRAIDGDTVDALISLPLKTATNRRLRLRGFFAPEMNGQTPDMAIAARDLLAAFLDSKRVWLRGWGMKEDKYGRLVVQIMDDEREVTGAEVLGALQMTEEAHRRDVLFARNCGAKNADAL